MIDIYKLKLHEPEEIKTGAETYMVTRVPGGWLYSLYRLDFNVITTTFVPFNNDMQECE